MRTEAFDVGCLSSAKRASQRLLEPPNPLKTLKKPPVRGKAFIPGVVVPAWVF